MSEVMEFSFKTEMVNRGDLVDMRTALTCVLVEKNGSIFIKQSIFADALQEGYVPLRNFFGKIYQCRVVGLKYSSFLTIIEGYTTLIKNDFIDIDKLI
jgi:hypothetical protein